MEMTSNCDVTDSAHQIQMTTIWPWTKRPHENFLRTTLPKPPLPRADGTDMASAQARDSDVHTWVSVSERPRNGGAWEAAARPQDKATAILSKFPHAQWR